MKRGLRLLTVLLTGALSGCSLAPEYDRPVVPLAEQFQQPVLTGESAANLKWWELFKDAELQSIIRETLANNRDLQVSLARIAEAQALVDFTRADQFPFIDLTAEASRTDVGRGLFIFSGPFNRLNLLGNLSFEVDLWGRLRNATAAQRAQLLSTSYNAQTVTLSLISTAADLYFALVDLDRRISISQRTLKNRVDARKLINARLSKGIATELELNQAQIEEQSVAATLVSLERERAVTEHALIALMGKSGGTVVRRAADGFALLPNIPAGVPAEILERRPDLLALEESIRNELYNEGVADALRYPSINIFGVLGLASSERENFFEGDSQSWSIGGSLFAPILNWGQNLARVQAQQAQVLQARLSYEGAVINSIREVEDALARIETFNREHEIRLRQIKAARNAEKLSIARYDDGIAPYLEVLDVQRSLYTAELSASQTHRGHVLGIITLYRALGGGWEVPPPSPS